jgi:hypothetical protein
MSIFVPGRSRLVHPPAQTLARRRIARRVLVGIWNLVLAGSMVCASAAVIDSSTKPGAVDFAPPPIDASFVRGLPVVKTAAGLRETNPGAVLPEWTPGLCMLIGFRTDIASKQFVHLVEVTTLEPRSKDRRGRPVVLPLTQQFFTFTGTNQFQPKPRTHAFSTLRYPVRVRLYNADGRFLKESREDLPWSFLTNGLVDVCAAFRELSWMGLITTNRVSAQALATNALTSDWLNAMEVRAARGGLALGGMFAVIGDSDALDEVRSHALAVVRTPNFLKALFELKLDIQLVPKFE